MVEIPSRRHGRVSSHGPASVVRCICGRVATAHPTKRKLPARRRIGVPPQQAGEKKASVASITDRFFVPANFEDLGCPQGEHYESPHPGIWSSEPRVE